jgi:hypothetical protein
LADQLFDAAIDFVADGSDVVNVLASRIIELPVFVAFAGLSALDPRWSPIFARFRLNRPGPGSDLNANHRLVLNDRI